MTVDQYTCKLDCDVLVEIRSKEGIVFEGTVRELQGSFYTIGQCEIKEGTYQLTEKRHYIKI